MSFTQETSLSHGIHSYEIGSITIIQGSTDNPDLKAPTLHTVTRSLIISPLTLITDWAPQQLAELEAQHLQALLDLAPEIVLLGVGRELKFPPATHLKEFHEHGIGVEIMDTAAACRTYNILLAEDRNVAAALMMIEDQQ